jgi:hypothetical protein
MTTFPIDRRALLAGTATIAAVLAAPGAAFAANGDLKAIRAAAEAGKADSVKRLQDWIRHPGIAAENWRMDESCDYTMGLLKDAGFQMVAKMPTDGAPGIFATLDAGAKRSVGIYFMYDVKQVNPTEWATPPVAAPLTRRARRRPSSARCMPSRRRARNCRSISCW